MCVRLYTRLVVARNPPGWANPAYCSTNARLCPGLRQQVYCRASHMSTADATPPSRIPEHYRCLNCDYVLARLEENRCPECGRPFDPHNRRTVNATGRRFPGSARFMYRAPGPLLILLLAAPILFTVWEYRRPGGDFHAVVGGFALWVICAAVWLIRLIVFAAIGMYYQRPSSETLRRAWRWAALPVALVAWFAVMGMGDTIQRGAFDLSRNSLEALARRGSAAPGGTRAGVLWIESVDPYDGGTLLMTGTGYDAHSCGYAWFPNGRPTDTESLRFHPFEGQWYIFGAEYGTYPPATRAVNPILPPTDVPR